MLFVRHFATLSTLLAAATRTLTTDRRITVAKVIPLFTTGIRSPVVASPSSQNDSPPEETPSSNLHFTSVSVGLPPQKDGSNILAEEKENFVFSFSNKQTSLPVENSNSVSEKLIDSFLQGIPLTGLADEGRVAMLKASSTFYDLSDSDNSSENDFVLRMSRSSSDDLESFLDRQKPVHRNVEDTSKKPSSPSTSSRTILERKLVELKSLFNNSSSGSSVVSSPLESLESRSLNTSSAKSLSTITISSDGGHFSDDSYSVSSYQKDDNEAIKSHFTGSEIGSDSVSPAMKFHPQSDSSDSFDSSEEGSLST